MRLHDPVLGDDEQATSSRRNAGSSKPVSWKKGDSHNCPGEKEGQERGSSDSPMILELLFRKPPVACGARAILLCHPIDWLNVSVYYHTVMFMFMIAEMPPDEPQSCISDDRIDPGGKPRHIGVRC